MNAFDTDVLTEILLGNPGYVQRAAAIKRRRPEGTWMAANLDS